MKKILLFVIGGIIVFVEGNEGFVLGLFVEELLNYFLKFFWNLEIDCKILMNIDSINM